MSDRPPWGLVGDLAKPATFDSPSHAAASAVADQTSAYYAELFEKFEISLRDERELYVAIVAVAVAATTLRIASENGRIPASCASNGRVVLRALSLALAHFVPEEVRP